jgi:hypothetical protein
MLRVEDLKVVVARLEESLRLGERNIMLDPVVSILRIVPFEFQTTDCISMT